MGKQHKKNIKRSRRKQYLKRKNEQVKASIVRKDPSSPKKTATKKVAAKKTVAKKAAKKAAVKKVAKKAVAKKEAPKKDAE